jgi:transcription elongation factor SPT6
MEVDVENGYDAENISENEGAPDEGEGDAVISDDSSEEPEEDAEEERRIREGFIVDEDEDDDDEDEDAEERRRRRKRRKHKHRRRERRGKLNCTKDAFLMIEHFIWVDDSDDGLEDDDLELLAENTGSSYKKNKLSRIRRGGDDESPPAPASRRKPIIESDDDDLEDLSGARVVTSLQNIWDDGQGQDDDDMDMDDMDAFIDDDDVEEGGVIDEEERERRRRERLRVEKERRKVMRSRPEMVGIDAR